MFHNLLPITALIALLPAALLSVRRSAERDGLFWLTLAVAISGTGAWIFAHQSTGWQTGLSISLWLTILTCLLLHSFLCLLYREAWRLSPLLLPYLLVLGILAIIWNQVPGKGLQGEIPLSWIGTHIIVSIATYGLITMAAVAALAATLKHRAIRSKKRTQLSSILPPVAASEGLLVSLLLSSAVILAAGLITGMAALYFTSGQLIAFNHKTILTGAVFIVLVILLVMHFKWGIRGKIATRLVLLAYLLLTLGYPGLKFVTDIIL